MLAKTNMINSKMWENSMTQIARPRAWCNEEGGERHRRKKL